MVTRMPDFYFENDGICRGCAIGKNAKKSFPSNNKRSKGILDLVHSDLCGLMSAPSICRCLYYMIFIDDFSYKTWIYFLKSKNEIFNKFRELKELIEKKIGRHTRALRTNNGGDFSSHGFDDFHRGVGIKSELTIPFSP